MPIILCLTQRRHGSAGGRETLVMEWETTRICTWFDDIWRRDAPKRPADLRPAPKGKDAFNLSGLLWFESVVILL